MSHTAPRDVCNTHDAILTVASRLFAQEGYTAVSMSDIASQLGMTKANLYHHFKDKEHLIREVLTFVFTESTQSLLQILVSDASPEERLREWMRSFVKILFEDEIHSRLLLRELLDGSDDRLEYMMRTVFDRPFHLVGDLVHEISGRSHLMTLSIIGMMIGHFQMARACPFLPTPFARTASPDEVAEHVISLVFATLTGSPATGGCRDGA